MAKANFVKKAQKDIYTHGKHVEYESLKGKRAGQMKSKTDRTIPENENDTILIAAGESYYWWQFKNGPKHISKERPKQSQLTQSNYLGQLYSIQEQIDDIKCDSPDDLESVVDAIKSDLESLKEETEGSLENMPESLQSSPTGELLQERIDALDSAISEFENIDCSDYEEPEETDLKEEIAEEEGIDMEKDNWEEEITEEMLSDKKQEKVQEWLDEKINEIQGISLE